MSSGILSTSFTKTTRRNLGGREWVRGRLSKDETVETWFKSGPTKKVIIQTRSRTTVTTFISYVQNVSSHLESGRSSHRNGHETLYVDDPRTMKRIHQSRVRVRTSRIKDWGKNVCRPYWKGKDYSGYRDLDIQKRPCNTWYDNDPKKKKIERNEEKERVWSNMD